MILEIGSCRNLELFVSFQYYIIQGFPFLGNPTTRLNAKSENFEFVLTEEKKRFGFFGQNWLARLLHSEIGNLCSV